MSAFVFQLLASGSVRSYVSVKFDEGERAKKTAAALKETIGQPTIFSKIIDKSIPADIIYEDDLVVLICIACKGVIIQGCHYIVGVIILQFSVAVHTDIG